MSSSVTLEAVNVNTYIFIRSLGSKSDSWKIIPRAVRSKREKNLYFSIKNLNKYDTIL